MFAGQSQRFRFCHWNIQSFKPSMALVTSRLMFVDPFAADGSLGRKDMKHNLLPHKHTKWIWMICNMAHGQNCPSYTCTLQRTKCIRWDQIHQVSQDFGALSSAMPNTLTYRKLNINLISEMMPKHKGWLFVLSINPISPFHGQWEVPPSCVMPSFHAKFNGWINSC